MEIKKITPGHGPPWYIKWPASTGPTISTGNDAVDILKFTTYDQGTTWHGETIGQNFS